MARMGNDGRAHGAIRVIQYPGNAPKHEPKEPRKIRLIRNLEPKREPQMSRNL